MAATIYAYSSNNIYCTYTLSAVRSGSTVTITASGTIYGNGSSQDATSGQKLYAQLRYGVSPSQTQSNPQKGGTGTTTYVSNYGTLLENNGWSWTSSTVVGGYSSSTNSSRKIADNDSSSFPSLNVAGFPTGGRSFTITWTATNNSALSLSDVALFFFRDSTSTSVSSTDKYKVYTFVGKKDSSLSGNYSRYYTQSLSVGVGYTAVSAPTRVATSESIQVPGQNLTISWDGATAGTQNPISKYRIYWKTGVAPTTSSYNGYHDTNSTETTNKSWTLSCPSDRGSTYYFKVMTIGTASGYDSGLSSVQATTKVNTLPVAPTITISQGTTTIGSTIYRNKTGITTVRFTPSATSTDSQTNTYYYATSSTGTKTAFTSSTNFTPNENTTYYFWSYDTMEFSSSYTTKAITIGANLTGSMGATTSITTYSNNGTTYTTGGTNVVTLSSAGVGTKTYKWSLMYGASTGSMTSTQSLSSTSNSCTWAYAGSNGWSKYYQIKCVVSDQLSQSFTVTSSTYTIPSAPTFNTNIYNQLGTNVSTMPTMNVTGSKANDFYQTMVTSLTKDTSVTLDFSITPSASVGWYSGASNTTYRNSGVIPLTITSTSPNTTYTLKIIPTSAWGGTISTKTYTITSTGLPRINSNNTRYSASNINAANPSSIRPFKEEGDYNFNFLKANMMSNNNYTETSKSNTKLFLYYGNNEVEVLNQKTWTTNSTTGYITAPATRNTAATAGLYNWQTNVLNLNLNGSNTVGLRIKFTDVFGATHSVEKPNYLTLNFIETPTVTFTIGSSAGSTQGTIVKERDTITYTPNITFYNTDKAVTIRTYIYRSTSTSSQTGGSWELYNGTNPNNGITYTPSRGTSTASAIVYNTPITYTVGEITESKYLYFKINITYGSNTIDSNIPGTYYISQRHKKVDDLSVDVSYENDLFSYTTLLVDRGGGRITTSADDTATGLTEVNYGLQFSQTNDFSTFLWLNSEGVLVEPSEIPDWHTTSETGGAASYTGSNIDLGSDWDFYNIRPVYYTKIGNVEKTTYGLISTIYGISPTISYRKNQIGVNISNIENRYPEAIIAIGGATDKKYIEFHTVTANASIDLTTGALDGFIFDGGDNWGQS